MQSKSGKIKKETTRGQIDYIMDDEMIKCRRGKKGKVSHLFRKNLIWENQVFYAEE